MENGSLNDEGLFKRLTNKLTTLGKKRFAATQRWRFWSTNLSTK
jgi:hypothetical protein